MDREDEKKERKRQYDKARYQANRERRLECDKQYYHANREKIRERKKQYHQANREQISERNKTWYQANREQISERSQANREQKKNYNKMYRRSKRIEQLERLKNGETGIIYIMGCEEHNHIKIGKTNSEKSLSHRKNQIQNGSPFPIQILFQIEVHNYHYIEKYLHYILVDHHTYLEWFDKDCYEFVVMTLLGLPTSSNFL